MNIFAVDNNPKCAAYSLCDKHVVKMVLESTQLLSTVAQLKGFEGPYKMTHVNHPCTKWVASHPANWAWLTRHAIFLCQEYSDRYGKIHKCEPLIDSLNEMSPIIWKDSSFEDHSDYGEESHTPFMQCMPDKYNRDDAVEAYRAYYIGEKARFATWKLGKPDWFIV